MGSLEGIALATVVCSWTFTALVFLALALQFYALWYVHPARGIGGLDYATWLVFICSLALVCQTTWAVVDEGQGKHSEDETSSQFELVAKSLTANEVVWTFVTMLIRCIAIRFLFRIVRTVAIYERMLSIMLVLTILHGTTLILVACLICRPIAVGWDSSVPGICGNQAIAFIIFESVGLVLDLGIVLVPLAVVHGLKIPMRNKVAIGSAFAMGSL